jgi:hypothetical protein
MTDFWPTATRKSIAIFWDARSVDRQSDDRDGFRIGIGGRS